MSSGESANRYDDRNIATMEMVYGEGYMSAGGDAEVARILAGIDLRGKRVLDVGCGLGGAVVAMARDHGAQRVQGVDVDQAVLQRARALVESAGVASQVTLTAVEPGPLPFSEAEFDLVYVNAVSCHLQDLEGFFRDIRRVLTTGGVLVGNEWYKAGENPAFRQWDELLRKRGLNFFFVTRERFAHVVQASGFEQPAFADRTAAFAELARDALQRVTGDLHDDLVASLGEAGYGAFLEWTRARLEALADGGMHQGHFRALTAG